MQKSKGIKIQILNRNEELLFYHICSKKQDTFLIFKQLNFDIRIRKRFFNK
jgi:hypothetical protein